MQQRHIFHVSIFSLPAPKSVIGKSRSVDPPLLSVCLPARLVSFNVRWPKNIDNNNIIIKIEIKMNWRDMATLLRKVWESVSNRSFSNGDSPQRHRSHHSSSSSSSSSSLGTFDHIPSDILQQILRLLGPKEAAKMSVVCKSWKSLVSDNRLWIFFLQNHNHHDSWDSVIFSETYLRSGSPLQ